MGVYINMELPTSCGYCPLRHEARDGDECYLGASLTEYQKRPDDCPLVPVPEPHGRLIDCDSVLDGLAHKLGIRSLDYLNAQEKAIVSWFRNAPTIIPASEEGE